MTFAAGELEKRIFIPILDDALIEAHETFKVTLSNPSGPATLIPPTEITVTIQSDDKTTVSFVQANSGASETAGTLNLMVLRTGGAPAGESVQYTTEAGTASAGSDFTATSGTLTFSAGETQKMISVPILTDAVVEGDETFTIRLFAPTGTVLGATTVHTVTMGEPMTFTVSALSDNAALPPVGSLRRAVADARAGDTIEFEGNLTGTITLAGAELVIDKNLTIEGPGAELMEINGNQMSRVMVINAGVTAHVSGFTFRDARAPNGADATGQGQTGDVGGSGGAILNNGNLSISHCLFQSNHAGQGGKGGPPITSPILSPGPGGPGGSGGAIASSGSLSLNQCSFLQNLGGEGGIGGPVGSNGFVAFSGPGGAGGNGGAVSNSSTGNDALAVTNCSFEDNSAGRGGLPGLWFSGNFHRGIYGSGGRGGAIATEAGTVAVAQSTFFQNKGGASTATSFESTGRAGGGGGGVALLGGSLSMENCTLYENRAGDSGVTQGFKGVGGDGGGIYSSGNLLLVSCAVVANSAGLSVGTNPTGSERDGFGGGLMIAGGNASLRNTILAQNVIGSMDGSGPDIKGAATTLGHNLVGNIDGSSGITAGANGDLAGNAIDPLDPHLGPLVDNGGATLTLALLPGSPAFSAGDDTLTGTDQRGQPRLSGNHVDIGPVELQLSAISSFSFTKVTSVASETDGTATIVIARTGLNQMTETVQYATDSGTAISGTDFFPRSGTVTFAAGEDLKSIVVPIVNDAAAENDEIFTMTLSTPSGSAVLGNPSVQTVTIQSEDASEFAFAETESTVAETAGSIGIKVIRTGPNSTSQAVRIKTSAGTAVEGSDFGGVNNTITFGSGETEKVIHVPIFNDTTAEADEQLTVTLSQPTNGAVLGAASTHTVTIQSDEPPPLGTIAFAQAQSTVAETAGVAVLTVTRTGFSAASQSLDYTVASNGALAGSDFVDSSGTLTFGVGETEKQITVTILNDALVEGDEEFRVVLSPPNGGAVLGDPYVHYVTIQSEDLPHGLIAFAQAASTATELDSTLQVTVTRSNYTPAGETVQYTTNSASAMAGSDFTATSGTLTFAAGETQKFISVPILNDQFAEGDETFTITLSNPGGGAVLGAQISHTVTLFSDEQATSGIFHFAVASSSVSEAAGAVQVMVQRSGLTPANETVQFATASGSATSGTDFTATNGTLTFAAGETEKTLTIHILNDVETEADETFSITLSAPGGGAVLGAPTTHTVTITNSTPSNTPEIHFAMDTLRVSETAGKIHLPVLRSGPSTGTHSVHYTVTNGTATNGTDFQATDRDVSFTSNSIAPSIEIPIVRNAPVEGDETFTIKLSNPTGGAVLGNPATITVTISDKPRTSTYHGLAVSRAEPDFGFVAITVSGLDRFTAVFRFGGRSYRQVGELKFGTATVSRNVSPGQSFSLSLAWNGDGSVLMGTVTPPVHGAYDFQLHRAAVGTVAQPVPGTGYYTALLGADSPAPLRGYVTARVLPTGAVLLSGVLPDGTAVVQGTRVNVNGEVPLYFAPRPNVAGYAGGPVRLDRPGSLPFGGDIRWVTAGLPPAFSNEPVHLLDLNGAPYVRRNGRMLDDFDLRNGAGSIHYSGVGITNTLTSTFTLLSNHRVIVPLADPQKTVLRMTPVTGLFAGSFLHPDGKRRVFKGACVQQAGALPDFAQGLFIHPSGAGVVEITAP